MIETAKILSENPRHRRGAPRKSPARRMGRQPSLRIVIPDSPPLGAGGETPDGNFRVKRRLGGGLESDVFAVEPVDARPCTPPEVQPAPELALKVLKERYHQPHERVTRLARELRHSHILRELPLGADGGADGNAKMLVSELCAGDLLQAIREAPAGRLPALRVLRLAREVGGGLAHMHSKRWYHLDVKPENVLLRKHSGEFILADFGCAVSLAAGGKKRHKRPQGSLAYLPQECHARRESAAPTPESLAAVDSWALGMTLLAALTGALPWAKAAAEDPDYEAYRALRRRHGAAREELLAALCRRIHWPRDLRGDLADILLGLLEPEAALRMTAAEAARRARQTLRVASAPALSALAGDRERPRKRRRSTSCHAMQSVSEGEARRAIAAPGALLGRMSPRAARDLLQRFLQQAKRRGDGRKRLRGVP